MRAAPGPDQQLRGSTTADERIQQALSQHGGSFAGPPTVWLCAKSVALHVDEVACSGLRSGYCKSVASMLLLHQILYFADTCLYCPPRFGFSGTPSQPSTISPRGQSANQSVLASSGRIYSSLFRRTQPSWPLSLAACSRVL